MSTVLFSDRSEVLHDRVKLSEVPPLTERDYTVGGCTALLDAIGGAIHHITTIHRYTRPEDVPARTVFVITTDGMENASHRYDADRVKRMIEHEKEKYGWEFVFMAANIDAVSTAARYGISSDRAVNYHADSMGTQTVFESVGEIFSAVRARRSVDAGWHDRAEADYNARNMGTPC